MSMWKGFFLVFVVFRMGIPAIAEEFDGVLSHDDMRFLKEMTAAVVEASRVPAGEKVGDVGPNVTGGLIIRPGGRACYPAFWIRDYAMSLECGLIRPEEQRFALLLTAKHQPDDEIAFRSGSVAPAGSIPDHIGFNNRPIFFAGCLDDFDKQGGPNWGKYPCLDDHFFFIHMAAEYARQTGDYGILKLFVNGRSLVDRLERAFAMPPSRPHAQLVYADEDARGVTFGFVDTITHTGELLFCSLLKYRAAGEMAGIYHELGEPRSVERFERIAAELRAAIPAVFATKGGLLRASTGKSGQPDVWGTAFAVYVGALDPAREKAACDALAQAYRDGTLAWRGNVRHVLTTDDFSATTAWEATQTPKNRYQNGAYWGTPTGWVCYAIWKADADLARRLAKEYVEELREGDFRKGHDFGSPWECMHPEGNYRQNPVYMTSVTCPLAAFQRIAHLSKGQGPDRP